MYELKVLLYVFYLHTIPLSQILLFLVFELSRFIPNYPSNALVIYTKR